MSGIRNSPTSPRFPQPKMDHQHHNWDDTTPTTMAVPSLSHNPTTVATASMIKLPTRTTSSTSPYKCPKSPRSFHIPAANVYDSSSPLPPRSPSIRSTYSSHSNYSDPSIVSRNRYDNSPRSPKITTTYANDSCDDASSTPSYYQTPTGFSSNENSLDSPACSFLSGHTPSPPRRSPKSPRKFVFDAISPIMDQSCKKLEYEYYDPISPDDELACASNYYETPVSPRRQNSKKLIRSDAHDKLSRGYAAIEMAGSLKRNEWEFPFGSHIDEHCLSSGSFYMKRDSCVTESTQLSVESNDTTNSTVATTTTSFSYSDHSKPMTSEKSISGSMSPVDHCTSIQKRRHAINITSNPGYQVLHSSHSTLDRTCSDSVVSLRYRKSTSDLTKDTDNESGKHKLANDNNVSSNNMNYKPRRRGSSKGGLAYLASRRSSRESMKSACSNTSIFSNDDIGPLAFQASNRGRQRRTSNFLELPVPDHVRPRVCSLPDRPYNPRVSDDLYRLRHFSISKGNVVNCGDSIISRRSRSNTSVNSTNSRASERSPFEGSCCGGGYANVDSLPASPDDSDNLDPPPPPRYRVVMLGDAGVGKTALVNQFMTSEYMHTYDASLDDEFGEKTVSVLLDDEESELVFIDHPSVEMSVENSLSTYEPHGCVVVFSVVDKSSFRVAEEIINYLWQENYIKDKAVILVGNKADLARARVITSQDGKSLAASRDAKFIETSSGIQHNVDELLVGILKQMRLKESREKKAISSKMRTSRTHISLHLAKEILQKICLSDISKSKSCENLHVL
ncbi:uncharacterized protein LOC119682044 [Teleopsis dalmanni]|uniref:uncharacterized protein LOC119682044 n=1 Tax=Teleopsis dalmanni TaxID=139649 RepID=UPI0018CD452D|nr:uncharacterized protein LOC119682044 [Teleopsis dalmanni]